jgi:hypothetical protein
VCPVPAEQCSLTVLRILAMAHTSLLLYLYGLTFRLCSHELEFRGWPDKDKICQYGNRVFTQLKILLSHVVVRCRIR